MQPDDLIRIARYALQQDSRRPSQAVLRRALSTTYYALFHALARTGADLLVGETKNSRSNHAWRQVYRALEHGKAKKDCRNKKITKRFPSGIRNFCDAFVLMQELRQKADYDPYTEFGNPLTKFLVEDNIDRAERVIKDFNAASKKDRRAFSTYVLFKTYPS